MANPSPQTLVADAGVYKVLADDGGVYWSDRTGIHTLAESDLTAPPTDLLAWSQVDAGRPLHAFALGSATGYLVATLDDMHFILEAFPRSGLIGSPDLIGNVATYCPVGGYPYPNELLVDDRAAYFSNNNDAYHCGVAYAVPLGGGAAAPVPNAINYDLVLDSDYLYGKGPFPYSYDLHAVPVTASPSHPPPPNLGRVGSYAVDSTSIYYSREGDPLAGVVATNFFDGGTRTIDRGDPGGIIAVNRNNVFWFFEGQLREAAK